MTCNSTNVCLPAIVAGLHFPEAIFVAVSRSNRPKQDVDPASPPAAGVTMNSSMVVPLAQLLMQHTARYERKALAQQGRTWPHGIT